MNSLDWVNVLAQIPALVTSIEQTVPQSGTGVQKLAGVIAAVAPIVPQEKLPAISNYVSALVALYNLVGFFKKPPALEAPQ